MAPALKSNSTDELINMEFQSQTIGLGDNPTLCEIYLYMPSIVVIAERAALVSYWRGFVNSYPDSGKWPHFGYLQS